MSDPARILGAMTAALAPFDPAPAAARFLLLLAVLWSRARSATRARARSVRAAVPAMRAPLATLVQLAGGLAAVKTGFVIAPAVGWAVVTVVLGVAGWLLQPPPSSDEGHA